MTATRLHAVHVASRDLGAARRLWADLLGGHVLEDGTARLQVVLPRGTTLVLELADGPTGVTGATLAVDDPETVAAAVRGRTGIGATPVDDGLELDVTGLLGGQLRLVPHAATPWFDVTGGGAAGVTAFDHLCFGVRDLAGASELLRATGGRPVFGGDSPYGIRSLHLAYEPGKLELLSPLRDDSEVGRHLARRGGPSPHHVTLLVEDVPAARSAAEGLGFETTWTNLEHDSWRDTYLRPASTDGVVVQLATTTRAYHDTLTDEDYEGVFEGSWWVAYHQMRPMSEVAP